MNVAGLCLSNNDVVTAEAHFHAAHKTNLAKNDFRRGYILNNIGVFATHYKSNPSQGVDWLTEASEIFSAIRLNQMSPSRDESAIHKNLAVSEALNGCACHVCMCTYMYMDNGICILNQQFAYSTNSNAAHAQQSAKRSAPCKIGERCSHAAPMLH